MLNKENSKKKLKYRSLKVNKEIYLQDLSILNFGNASVIDKERKKIFIKASGMDIESCNLSSIVEVDIKKFDINNYKNLRPSVDTVIHIELYNYLKNINCIIHTHPEYSTIISQSNIEPDCYGTTHADYFKGKIPISDKITKVNKNNYEHQVAQSIISKLKRKNFNYPGILLRDHGVFAWGEDEKKAINNLIAIEFICKLYFKTKFLSKKSKISKSVADFHFYRKHSKGKYYGQTNLLKKN